MIDGPLTMRLDECALSSLAAVLTKAKAEIERLDAIPRQNLTAAN